MEAVSNFIRDNKIERSNIMEFRTQNSCEIIRCDKVYRCEVNLSWWDDDESSMRIRDIINVIRNIDEVIIHRDGIKVTYPVGTLDEEELNLSFDWFEVSNHYDNSHVKHKHHIRSIEFHI